MQLTPTQTRAAAAAAARAIAAVQLALPLCMAPVTGKYSRLVPVSLPTPQWHRARVHHAARTYAGINTVAPKGVRTWYAYGAGLQWLYTYAAPNGGMGANPALLAIARMLPLMGQPFSARCVLHALPRAAWAALAQYYGNTGAAARALWLALGTALHQGAMQPYGTGRTPPASPFG